MVNLFDLIECYARNYKKYILHMSFQGDVEYEEDFYKALREVIHSKGYSALLSSVDDLYATGFAEFSDETECALLLDLIRETAKAINRDSVFAVTYGPYGGIDEL